MPTKEFEIDPDKTALDEAAANATFPWQANANWWFEKRLLPILGYAGWTRFGGVSPQAQFAPFPLAFWPSKSGILLFPSQKTVTHGEPLVMFGREDKLVLVVGYDPDTQIIDLNFWQGKFNGGVTAWKYQAPEDWVAAAADAIQKATQDWTVEYKQTTQDWIQKNWWEYTVRAPGGGPRFNDYYLAINQPFGFTGPFPHRSYGGGIIMLSGPNITAQDDGGGAGKGQFCVGFVPSRFRQMGVWFWPGFAGDGTPPGDWEIALGDDGYGITKDWLGNDIEQLLEYQNQNSISSSAPASPGCLIASACQLSIVDFSQGDDPGLYGGELLGGKSVFVSSPAIIKDQQTTISSCIIGAGPGISKTTLAFVNDFFTTPLVCAVNGAQFVQSERPGSPRVAGCVLPAVEGQRLLTNAGGALIRNWRSVYVEMPGFPSPTDPSRIVGKLWNAMLIHSDSQVNSQIQDANPTTGKTMTFRCVNSQLGGPGFFGVAGTRSSLWIGESLVATVLPGGGESAGPLIITSGSPPPGTVGQIYNFALRASGGFQPVTWSVEGDAPFTTSFSLPPGIEIGGGSFLDNGLGSLVGRPTVPGAYSFTITARDQTGATVSATYLLIIFDTGGGSAMFISSGAPPSGKVGVPYSFTMTESGGTAPISWSYQGNLPPGIQLSGPTLSGSPTAGGIFAFSIYIIDSLGFKVFSAYSITITVPTTTPPGPPPPNLVVITSGAPPDGTVGTPYSYTFTASGGTAPIVWSYTGTLPPGIGLTGDTLTGTPTAAGSADIIITATDATGAKVWAAYTFSVRAGSTEWSLTVPALPHALISSPGYLWVGCETIPGTLTRIDLVTRQFTTLTFPNDHAHEWLMDAIYLPSKGKVYCMFGHPLDNLYNIATVSEVDPATMAYRDVISDPTYNPEQGSMCADSTYMYVLSRTYNLLARYSLATWLKGTDCSLAFMPQPHAVRYDPVSNKIFATSANTNNPNSTYCIARINPTTFTVEQYANVAIGNAILTDDFAMTNDYVWCGSEQSGRITRFLKADLTSQTTITITEMLALRCVALFWDGAHIWAGWWGSSPGTIAKIDPVTLAYTLYTMPFDSPNEIWADNAPGGQAGQALVGVATKLYLTSYLSPGKAYSFTL